MKKWTIYRYATTVFYQSVKAETEEEAMRIADDLDKWKEGSFDWTDRHRKRRKRRRIKRGGS